MTALTLQSPGLLYGVPWDEYRQLPGLSISRLKEMARSPLHYLHRLDHPRETPALSLGTAAHAAILEPERFAQEFAVWDRRTEGGRMAPRHGKAWDAFLAEHYDKTIITEDEYIRARGMQQAVRSHPVAAHYLEAGFPEVTMLWEMGGFQCRGRVDWLTVCKPYGKDSPAVPHVIGLKTAADCRHMEFSRSAARYGYHLQWGFYFDGYSIVGGCEPREIEIVVESEAPHAVAVYAITRDIIDQGRDEYQELMLRLAECESTGHFPGPQDTEEPLTLPSWVYQPLDDLSDLGLEEK